MWQASISLHLTPRFVYLWLYQKFYQARIPVISRWTRYLIRWAGLFNLAELLSLLGLSLVSSLENFDIHKICFVIFGVSGLIYFLLTYLLWSQCGLVLETNEEIRSFKLKKSMLKLYLVCGCLMSYFYYRHNEYCEPYVYSFFCLCEYVIVCANMVFHQTASYDFAHVDLVVPSRPRGYLPLTR